jgi:hypothetical protein
MIDLPAWLSPALAYIPQWLGYQMRLTEQPARNEPAAVERPLVTPGARLRPGDHQRDVRRLGRIRSQRRLPGLCNENATIPAQDLTVSCLTNAVDGLAHTWLDGALAILKRFQEDGAPAPALADWSGRWWSAWGVTDLVPVGEKVLLASPGMTNPFLKVPELTLTGPDAARISQAGAFASNGEPARLVRNGDGTVVEVLIAGGRSVTEAALPAELVARYER